MNPNTKPIRPKTSQGTERDMLRFLAIYQAAVEDDAPYHRLHSEHAMQHMGSVYAAEITGRTQRYIQNTLNPLNDSNPPGLKEFYRLWRSGLDEIVIHELLRPRRMVAFALPDTPPDDHQGLAIHAVAMAKEVGDVFAAMDNAFHRSSELGCDVSQHELEVFSRECLEVIPKLLVLIEDMKQVAV